MAVDELLRLIDGPDEVSQTISEESLIALQRQDPEFEDKLVMSHTMGGDSGIDPSQFFDNYEAASKANGGSGNAALDRSNARAELKISAQYDDVGYWKSAAGSTQRGGLRAGQFTDSLDLVFAQSKIDSIDEELEKRQAFIDEEPTTEIGKKNKAFKLRRTEGREDFLNEQKQKWTSRRNDQILDYTKKQVKILAIPLSKKLREFQQTEGIEGVKKLLNPSVLSQVLVEELVASSPSLAITIGGGVTGGLPGAAAGAGIGEYAQGIANNFFGYLQKQGIDTSNNEAVLNAIDDNQLFDDAFEFAMIKSTPEALAAAVSVGAATKGKPLANALLLQPSLAGIGVIGSSLIVGEDLDIKEIATEMIAEMGSGSIEVGVTRMLKRTTAFKDKTTSANGRPMNAAGFKVASESVDTAEHTEGMSNEEAFLTEKARDGDARAVKMIGSVHEASKLSEDIGITGGEKIVGLTKAESARTREALGEDPLAETDVQSEKGQLDLAKQEGFDEKALTIASEIIDSPRQLTTKEFSGFVLKKTQLENAVDDLDVQIIKAQNEGASTKQLKAKQAVLEKEILRLDDASTFSGTVGARAQAIRRMMLNTEDFSIRRLLNKAESAKGKPLDAKERAEFEKSSAEIANLKSLIRQQNAVIKSLGEGKVDQSVIDKLTQLKVKEFKVKAGIKKSIRDMSLSKKFAEKNAAGKVFFGVTETLMASRTMRTMGDISTVLRQGGFFFPKAAIKSIATRKLQSNLSALAPSIKTIVSEDKAIEIDLAIREHPNQVQRDAAGLELSSLDRLDLTSREESIASNLVEMVPGLRQVAFASERQMATYLNLVRVAEFDSFLANHPESGQEVKNAMASYINSSTGKGTLFGMRKSARALSILFFAPRFAISRAEHFGRSAALLKHKETRATVIADWAAFMGTGFAVLGLASLAGLDVGDDPLSSDFGKIVVGDTRIDIWAGFQQPFRLFAMYVLKGATTAGLTDIGKDVDITDATLRYMSYKAAPSITIPWEIIEGEDIIGGDKTLTETALGSITPLFLSDTYEVFKNTSDLEKSLMTLGLTGIGIGVTEQSKRTKKKERAR